VAEILRTLATTDITEEYASWWRNTDGFLNYFSASGFEPSRGQLLVEIVRADARGDVAWYAIVFTGPNRVTGSLKIGPIDRRHGIGDLVAMVGYRYFAGRGLGSEAVRQGTGLAFQRHGVRKLQSGM
jgi:RimJ/RimL family protein N-acetyltransferase